MSDYKFGDAERLRTFKELLDAGAITQEEFDAIKKGIFDCRHTPESRIKQIMPKQQEAKQDSPDNSDKESPVSSTKVQRKEENSTFQVNDYRNSKRKSTIVISAIVLVILIIFLGVAFKTNANLKLANEIHSNFLGKTFAGENESDDAFYQSYITNSLNPYKDYWLTTATRTLIFSRSGAINYISTDKKVALTVSDVKDSYNNDSGTYESFEVKISLSGRVYLVIEGAKYLVSIDKDNHPISIYYCGVLLEN